MLTLYYWGKNFKGAAGVRQAAEKLSRGGVKTIRWRNNYPARAEVPKNSKKNPKIVAQYRKYPIPYVYTLSRTIPYLYTLNRTIAYLYTLSRTIPYLNTLSRTIPYLNTLSRTIPYLNTLKKPKFSPKPNSCRQPIRIEHEKTLKPRQPIRIEYHSAETYPILIHCRNIPYLNTWVGDPSRSWARVGCYSLS